LADRGRCGACKAELAPLAEPLNVDGRAFDEIVSQSRVPVLVDFWAAWCGPCRMVAPEVEKLAREVAGKAVVLKVDTDRNGGLSARFDVRGIPSFIVFKGGVPVTRQTGAVSRSTLAGMIRQAG
jgi:thioredoxin 2